MFRLLCAVGCLMMGLAWDSSAGPPNVLWLYIEDMNPFLGSYGTTQIETPHMDGLAARGVLFEKAFVTAPVCSPCRSAIITGRFQTTTGVHNHNSSYPEAPIHLPPYLEGKTVPELFRAAGYYTFNQGKDHYNFHYDRSSLYANPTTQQAPWRDRPKGSPFFGQIQIAGGKYALARDRFNQRAFRLDPEQAAATLPPYYPNHPVILNHWAMHYDAVTMTDDRVGEILAELERDGLMENTILFCFSDHGCYMPRHKQFPYEGGLHVPLIVTWPGGGKRVAPGTRRSDLVSGLDIPASSLGLAGLAIPKWYDGANLFASGYTPREYVMAARDRCDYTIDRIRTIRTAGGMKYIRNFMTDRPWSQHQYRDGRDYMEVCRELYTQGELNEVQARFWGPERPAEELYDLNADPHEIHSLVDDPDYHDALLQLRTQLDAWVRETDDQGQYPESLASLTAVYRQWKGNCTNPEYAPVIAAAQASAAQRIAARQQALNYRPHPDQGTWQILSVSSEETTAGAVARNLLDGDPDNMWHSRWQPAAVPHPHTVVVDLRKEQPVCGLRILPRQFGAFHGAIAGYELHLSKDNQHWDKVAEGVFSYPDGAREQHIRLDGAQPARYLKLIALSEAGGGPWASAAELNILSPE